MINEEFEGRTPEFLEASDEDILQSRLPDGDACRQCDLVIGAVAGVPGTSSSEDGDWRAGSQWVCAANIRRQAGSFRDLGESPKARGIAECIRNRRRASASRCNSARRYRDEPVSRHWNG